MAKPVYIQEKCEGCGSCIIICPQGCISPLVPPKIGVEIDLASCKGCGKCITSCEWGALTTKEGEFAMKFLLQSCPSWALGPRAAHAKFGGNIIIGGIGPVENRIRAIAREFPDDLTSFHLLHELRTECGAYKPHNSPYAISWNELLSGIRAGDFPMVAAITAPAFGLQGIEGGAILSEDPTIRQMAHDLHKEAIEKSMFLKEEALGEGIIIWWPAWDSERENRGQVRTVPLSREKAWDELVTFWVILLEETDGVVHLEWKPKVPGRDYVNSIRRAICFCEEVNGALSRTAMFINNEWAHLLIGGTTVEEGTRLTIKAGLFSGFFHANSAELAVFQVDEAGDTIKGTPGEDEDWYVGAGGKDRWDDQRVAVALMAQCGVDRLIAEHDIDPSGSDPIEYYRVSCRNLSEMFESVG